MGYVQKHDKENGHNQTPQDKNYVMLCIGVTLVPSDVSDIIKNIMGYNIYYSVILLTAPFQEMQQA